MASVATRTPKRELAPDWRDVLRETARRFAVRLGGAALLALALAAALALATHHPTDPSLTTAAGGPPANWAGQFGAYSSDGLLLLFGIGAALFVPVVALAGLRMLRLMPAERVGRGLLLAAIGALLLGTALGLTSGSAVSGMPGGWGGALGLASAHGVDSGLELIRNPAIAGPTRFGLLVLFALGGLVLGYLALGISADERAWLRIARSRRTARAALAAALDRGLAATAAACSAAARPPGRRGGRTRARDCPGERAARRRKAAQPSLALGDSYQLPTVDLLAAAAQRAAQQVDRAGLERNARLLEIVLEDFHVRGDIVEVRPGPVVTMYELEPASGHQGQPGDPAGRRHRAQHVGAVGARRDHPGAQRDRDRAAQPQARVGEPSANWSEARRSRIRTWRCR